MMGSDIFRGRHLLAYNAGLINPTGPLLARVSSSLISVITAPKIGAESEVWKVENWVRLS
jgi:hypothetical protein